MSTVVIIRALKRFKEIHFFSDFSVYMIVSVKISLV